MFRAFQLLKRDDSPYLVVSVLCGLAVTLSLFLIYRSVHQIYQTELIQTLDLGLGVLAVLCVAVGIYTERVTAERLAQRVVSRVRMQVFRKILDASVSEDALHERSSTFLRLTSDMAPVRNWVVNGLVNGLVLTTVLVGVMLLLASVHPYLALTGFAAFTVLVSCSVLLGRQLSLASQEQRAKRTRLLDRVTGQFTSLPWILLYNQRKRERNRYRTANDALVGATLSKAHWSGLLRACSEAVMWCTFGALGLVGLILVKYQMIEPQQIVLVLTSSIFLLHRFRNLYQVFGSWASIQPSLDRIDSLMARKNRPRGRARPELNIEHSLLTFGESTDQTELHTGDWHVVSERQQAESSDLPYPLNVLGVPIKTLGGIPINRVQWTALTRWVAVTSLRFALRENRVEENLLFGYRALERPEVIALWEQFSSVSSEQHPKPGLDQPVEMLSQQQQFVVSLVNAVARKPKVILIDLYGLEDRTSLLNSLRLLTTVYSGAVLLIPRPYQRDWLKDLPSPIAKRIVNLRGRAA